MSTAADEWIRKRVECTNELLTSPYDASIYLERAKCHEELLYPEYAAGDAYKALLLNDEVSDEAGEYHEQAIEALQKALKNAHKVPEQEDVKFDLALPSKFVEGHSREAYLILARTLIACGDFKAAWDFADRGSRCHPADGQWQDIHAQILQRHGQSQLEKGSSRNSRVFNPHKDLPGNGFGRREVFPWNTHEPERCIDSALDFLNAELSKIAPKCEVRVVDLPILSPSNSISSSVSTPSQQTPGNMHKQLGLFATADIPPHETIFHEPSLLTANNHLYDTLCDACSSPLPSKIASSPFPTCPSCDDTVFCSAKCLARAQELYHPAVCGHPDFDLSARDPTPTGATDALYLLLLARTIAMAETQDLHPLDLREIKYLWGDFNSIAATSSISTTPARTLPFSFSTNILTPLHLLQNLDLDIFAPQTLQRYDFWVINTLMAKYRGVASAKMNSRTGMPEVCAVHWRWCLANHSCAPNVRWEWPAAKQRSGSVETAEQGGEGSLQEEEGGCMALIVRGGDEVVQWGSPPRKREGGIMKGEEILNHYCDVELPVEARREWAAGALGGSCMCERCAWEGAEKERNGGE